MSWCNFDDVRAQLEAAGLLLDDGLHVGAAPGAAGNWRVRVRDGGREKRGWYRLHEIQLASGERALVGSYGIFRGDANDVYKVELRRDWRARFDSDQLAAIKARQEADRARADAERALAVERAARRAAAWWSQCRDEGTTPYIEKKGLASRHGARISPDGNLVIPMHDAHRNVRGLQVIYSDPKVRSKKGRDKDYAPPGLAKKGAFFQMGAIAPGAVVLVCEGFATGASLHEATALPVVVAFDAGNLLPVALELRKHYRRRLRLLFCADDDYLATCPDCNRWTRVAQPACEHCGAAHGKQNTGVTRAQAAALGVEGAVCIPEFPSERPVTHKGATDFNDLHVDPRGGLALVSAQIEASLTAQGWYAQRSAPARALAEGGEGKEPLKAMLSLDEAVGRFSLVYGARGTFFDHSEHCLVAKQDVLDILPDHAWRTWKADPNRRIARLTEVGFDPSETDRSIRCNLWGGWPTRPRAGKCDVLLDLLRYLCGEEGNAPDIFTWVLNWLAFPIQHPGAKMKTALIFHGPQGTGKSLFFETVMAIYGEYGRIVDQAAIEDKFNDWASRKLFLIADEVVARAELYHVKNKLKHFVTGEWIRINPKNVAAHEERNHVNIVFLSNEKQPLVLEKDDRRYTVIWTPEQLSEAFYNDAAEQAKHGGVAALHHYLLNVDLGDFNEHAKPPDTSAKRELKALSGDSIDHFLDYWLSPESRHPLCPALSQDLYEAYTRWCRRNGELRPRTHVQFSGDLRKRPGWLCEPRPTFDDLSCSGSLRTRRVVIPPTDHLQKAKRTQPDTHTQARWLTESFFDFRGSLEAS